MQVEVRNHPSLSGVALDPVALRPRPVGGAPEEPDLVIHTLDDLMSDVRRRRGPVGTAVSVVAHAGLAIALVALPLLADSTLPAIDRGAVRAFFATPLELAPPPPPPPPPSPGARRPPEPTAPDAAPERGFVAPVQTPEEIPLVGGIELGVEGGVPRGVEGGVPGGVLGGVVGGLPEAPPPPPLAPVRVGGGISEPRKLEAVAPVYPDIARVGRIEGIVILECNIDPRGHVADVHVLRSDPIFDEAAVDAVRQWVYSPTLVDGVPVPVLLTVTIRFQLSDRP